MTEAKINMIKQQICTYGIHNKRILNAIDEVPREEFVPTGMETVAYAEMQVSLAHNQVMFLPATEARILNFLNIESHEKVLEIGTGSGYLTALLAKLSEMVVSIDIEEEFVKQAKYKLKSLGIYNIKLDCTNGLSGYPENAPYDVVIIGGAVASIPECIQNEITIGGRIFAFIGTGNVVEATIFNKRSEAKWDSHILFETSVLPLNKAESTKEFIF